MKQCHKFTKHLSEAIKDEKKAPPMYSKLRTLATTKKEKAVISSIIRDEQRHGRLLKKMRR
jgi:rubrerythrin